MHTICYGLNLRMHFSELASFFHTIENTSSRNEMTKILAELFKKLHEDEIDKVIYLLQGRIAPTYVKIDFGLGEKLVIKAITRALNIEHKHFMNRYKSKGDIGEAAEFFKKEIRSIGGWFTGYETCTTSRTYSNNRFLINALSCKNTHQYAASWIF